VIRRRLAHALDRRFEALHHRVERLEDELRHTRERLDHELYATLRILAGRDAESRRLLAAARATDDYRLAWDNPNPLVTVIVPTLGRLELLRSRALPAVLDQTHQRLEVLVVGDGPNAEAETVVREAGDPRLRWANTSQRYVYPDEYRHWLAATTLAGNEGYRLAEGRWLFDLDDDDSLPADAIESLLAAARASRAEAVQGVITSHAPQRLDRPARRGAKRRRAVARPPSVAAEMGRPGPPRPRQRRRDRNARACPRGGRAGRLIARSVPLSARATRESSRR